MPSPYHKCANPECTTLVNPRAIHCKHHAPHTAEWHRKIADANRGKPLSAIRRLRLSITQTARAIAKGRASSNVTCQHCGKMFRVKPHRLEKGEGKFCSSRCAYAARRGNNSPLWKGGNSVFTCEQCGRQFNRPACQAKGQHSFCSYSCKGIYLKSHQKNKSTKIELAMRDALLDVGLLFREQVPFCNATVADFYLPIDSIAIFCDGDYWHSLPEHLARDSRQTQILEQNNIRVLRFKGSQIQKNIATCVSRIKAARRAPR